VDELATSGLDVNANARSAGVQGILDQFLDHRSRTLDHFAGSDLVRDMFGENVNASHMEAAPGLAANESNYGQASTELRLSRAAVANLEALTTARDQKLCCGFPAIPTQ
jgi:hypothetical protein